MWESEDEEDIMKIAYIVPSLRPLGPVIVVRNLVEQMKVHGHECVVFYFDEATDGMTFACETRRISFWKRIDTKGIDWVHTHCFRPMVYGLTLRNVKKITTLHSYLFTEYEYALGKFVGPLLGQFTMWVARHYNKVAVLSMDAKEYYSRWIPKEKLEVCYNGVAIERNDDDHDDDHDFLTEHKDTKTQRYNNNGDWERIKKFKGEGVLIGCICELAKIKNVDLVVRAMRLLPEKFRLLLIGTGDEKKALLALANSIGVGERVLFLGERPEAHRFLPLVDVFAMTSKSEGFCLALTEAAMYGKRIVCAEIPGMREKYSDDEVTYFDVYSEEALVKAILLAEQDEEKAEMACAKAKKEFSAERMCERYLKVYQHFLLRVKG